MQELLSPKMDFIFKKIFGNEKNKDILISLLNAILTPRRPIEFVEIKNTDIEKEYLRDKFSKLDIKAKTSNGEIINIEMQVNDKKNMVERSLYYWSKMYAENIVEKEDYATLPRTVCINILDYDMYELKDVENHHNVCKLYNTNTNKAITDKIEIHFIELKKFTKCDKDNLFDVWLEFIKQPSSSVISEIEETNNTIKKAKRELKIISSDEKERERYRIRQEIMLEEKSALSGARLSGELKKSVEIAINLLKILDNDDIASTTGLSIDEVAKLRSEHNE